MLKKLFVFIMLVFSLGVMLGAPAQAAIPINCIFDQPRQITTTTIESYPVWLARQKLQLNSSNCFKDTKAVKSIYDTLAKNVLLDIQQSTKNSFNKRYDSCTKGGGVTINPASWFLSLKCLFTTSFFPSSDVLSVKFKELTNDFKSHQPTSYVPVALGVINNVKENWGGVDCSSGALTASVTIPNIKNKLNFVIPCKPPSPLAPLRTLAVIGVWLGFAFWLYNTALSFWKERQ